MGGDRMYKLRSDLLELMKQAGYPPSRLRKEKILSESTIQRLRNNEEINITIKCLVIICGIIGTIDVFEEDIKDEIR